MYLQILKDCDRMIRKIAFVHFPHKEWLEDLYQEIRLNIWQNLEHFKGSSSLTTYIYRIALNVAILYAKKRNNFFNHEVSSDEIANLYNFVENDSNDTLIQELYMLINKLNSYDKSIITLYLEGISHKEIAKIIGITTTNVGTKISRIITKIKKINNEIKK